MARRGIDGFRKEMKLQRFYYRVYWKTGVIWMRTIIILALMISATLATPISGEKTPEEWLESGVDLGERGEYREAILAFDEAIELNLRIQQPG